MEIRNWFYLRPNDESLKKLFDLIKADYESMKTNLETTGENKYKEDYIKNDKIQIRMDWKFDLFGADEDTNLDLIQNKSEFT